MYQLYSNVQQYGFVIAQNVGIDPQDTINLAKEIGYIRDTHFGQLSDLTLRANGTHIADYPINILPHTDETYRSVPTGINIFHCIYPSSDGGGGTVLVDGYYCANELLRMFPKSFELLTNTAIQHQRHTDRELIRSNHPVFTVDRDGSVVEVRLNERTMSAISVSEEQMGPVYDALRKTFDIAYSSDNSITYRLESGEAVIIDNLRVLHGRTSFKGDRLLRQKNVMRDEFYQENRSSKNESFKMQYRSGMNKLTVDQVSVLSDNYNLADGHAFRTWNQAEAAIIDKVVEVFQRVDRKNQRAVQSAYIDTFFQLSGQSVRDKLRVPLMLHCIHGAQGRCELY